jgi:hypothetical protein
MRFAVIVLLALGCHHRARLNTCVKQTPHSTEIRFVDEWKVCK